MYFINKSHVRDITGSSKSSGLSFAFHKFENVPDSDGTLDISDKVSFICLFTGNEGDFYLGDSTSGSGSS